MHSAENLLLTADQKTVKLADFGLAREESLTEMMTAETGTYRWMAGSRGINAFWLLCLSYLSFRLSSLHGPFR